MIPLTGKYIVTEKILATTIINANYSVEIKQDMPDQIKGYVFDKALSYLKKNGESVVAVLVYRQLENPIHVDDMFRTYPL